MSLEDLKYETGEYIASLLRQTARELKTRFDCSEWILIVPSFSELAGYDSIIGTPIYVVASLQENFKLACKAENELDRKFLRTFEELTEEFPIEDSSWRSL
jgi:hypothetical protein